MRARRPDESGLVTLDWVILVSMVMVIASMSVVVTQRSLDDSTGRDNPVEAPVMVHMADIAAVRIETAANAERKAAHDGLPQSVYTKATDDGFKAECEAIETQFADIVTKAEWTQHPDLPIVGVRGLTPATRLTPARCEITWN